MSVTLDEFYSLVAENGYWTHPGRLRFYLETLLFREVELEGRTLLDIGGGNGLFGFYAALRGARRVIVMEPESDGSSAGVIRGFQALKRLLGDPDNIVHTPTLLGDYDRANGCADVILMHNSINHIDERACIELADDEAARRTYLDFFALLDEVSAPDGDLIVCDCARRNLFGDLGLTNPFARTIEWEKHQSPRLWSEVLERRGFRHASLTWTSPNAFGELGRPLRNALGSYLTLSHFCLKMKHVGAVG